MSSDFAQFQEAFFEEAAEHLAVVEYGLLQLEQHPKDLDLLNKIFRSAHSIKGTAGMFGFNAVSQFTHKMETLLDLLRNGQKTVSPSIADLLLSSTDCLKTLIESVKIDAAVDEATVQRLTTELASASASDSQPAIAKQAKTEVAVEKGSDGAQTYKIAWTPPDWLFQRGLDPLQFMKELKGLGNLTQVTLDMTRLPHLSEIDPEKCYLSWEMQLTTSKDLKAIEAAFEFVREDSWLLIEKTTVPGSGFQVPSSGSEHKTRNLQQETGDGSPKPLGEILVESG
ncbi:MAG: hypothetical protein HC801_03285, partial [Nitrospira sp.]|nr:hypothetical protein [Nitrospira sp.]